MVTTLQNLALDRWVEAPGGFVDIPSAVDGKAVARASSAGLDFGAMVRHAREVGGPGVALDLGYMRSLGPAALIPLVELEHRPLAPEFADRVAYVRGELTSELQADPGGRAGDQGRTARGAGGTHGSSKPVLAPIRQPGPA